MRINLYKTFVLAMGLSCAAFLCACASQSKQVAEKNPQPVLAKNILSGEYKLNQKFSDEFVADSLNFNKWNDFYPTWDGRKNEFFVDRKNVRVEDGKLVLTLRKENPENITPEFKLDGRKYSAACVRSKERILYGYFEIKFKAMDATVCNAFWLNDPLNPPKKYRPGDKVEEIDIFELFGKSDPTNKVHGIFYTTTHEADTPYVESKVWLGRKVKGEKTKVQENFSKEFNVAGFLWTPEKLVWTLNGRVVDERVNEAFHRPLYINIDCETMLGWGGGPKDSDLPAEYFVEYVRVWQK